MKVKLLFVLGVFLLFTVGCQMIGKESINIYTGTVEADAINISSEVSGLINEIYVKEGEKILNSTKVAKIDTTALKIQLRQAEAGLLLSQARFDEVVNGARDEELRQAKAQVAQLAALKDGAKKSYDYALEQLTDIKVLFAGNSASEKEVESAQAQVDSALANLTSIENQYEAANAQLDMLVNGATNEKVRMAQADVDKTKAQIELLEYQISRGTIQSPIGGIVEVVNYQAGELVQSGSLLISVMNPNQLWVKVYIPEKELHKVILNKEVKLSSDALGIRNIKGKVVYIASEAEFTPKNVESRESKEEMVFQVKIKLINPIEALKPGMLVDVVLDGEL